MPRRSTDYMQQKREEIVSAAIDCLTRVGMAAASLNEICAAARISRGALYVHFESKDEIMEAVVDRFSADGLQALQFASADELRKVLDDYLRVLASPPYISAGRVELELILASTTSERLHLRLAAARAARHAVLLDGLEHVRERGEVLPDVDLAVAATAIDACLAGILAAQGLAAEARGPLHRDALALVLRAILRPPRS